MNSRLEDLDARSLRLNLVFTQGLLLTIAVASSLFSRGWQGTLSLFASPSSQAMWWAAAMTAGIVIANVLMERLCPRHWLDESGLNRRIFADLSPAAVFLLCLLVGLSEEWLFRGVLHPILGNGWTSLLFTFLHVRYWRRPLLLAVVFGISWLLGTLFQASGSLWPVIAVHTLVDFLSALMLTRGRHADERGKDR